MTPTLNELLTGCFLACSQPVAPEAMGDFMSGRIGIVAMTTLLGAQESEKGPATRIWENEQIRVLIQDSLPLYGQTIEPLASEALAQTGGDGSISQLDAANALLRRALIALHIAVETAADVPLDRRILKLYRDMAERHRLDLPMAPTG
jgi:hypothetical protein